MKAQQFNEFHTQLSGTFPFIKSPLKLISTSVRKSLFLWRFRSKNDGSVFIGMSSSRWMLVSRGYWGIRSGSCSSSIVSILPLVLMLVPVGLNLGLEKASTYNKMKKRGSGEGENWNSPKILWYSQQRCPASAANIWTPYYTCPPQPLPV